MENKLLFVCLILALAACHKAKEPPKDIHSEADLTGLTVAAVTGSCYDIDLSGREDITLLRFNTETDLIQSVVKGRADVCVNDEVIYDANTRRELGVKIAFLGDQEFPSGFGFRKDNIELVSQCNDMLARMASDGSLDSLCHFWLDDIGIEYNKLQPHPEIKSDNPIRVACSCSVAPISFMIGQSWYGLECDLMYRLGEWTGRGVEFKYYDAVSFMFSLETGVADVLTGCMFITPEREKTIAFSTPYYKYHPAYFVKDPDAVTAKVSPWQKFKNSLYRSLVVEERWKFITGGLLETLKITFFSILFGSALGVALCAAARSRRKWARRIAAFYGWFMSGIPMLVFLLIMFYVILAKVGMGPTAIAVAAFSMFFAAGAGSVFKNSLDAIPKGQTEAGLALGFTRYQTFTGIVLPQAVRYGLPFYKGLCIGLLKETAIVGYIAIQDLTRAGDIIRSRTFDALVPLLLVTVIYFILAWLISYILGLAAKKRSL